VHQNKPWGFREEGAWAKACARLGKLRNGLGFED